LRLVWKGTGLAAIDGNAMASAFFIIVQGRFRSKLQGEGIVPLGAAALLLANELGVV
jgi:hypothetical protein